MALGRIFLYGGVLLIFVGLAFALVFDNFFLKFCGIMLVIAGPAVSSVAFFARKRKSQ